LIGGYSIIILLVQLLMFFILLSVEG
jgi:hypothetical protein